MTMEATVSRLRKALVTASAVSSFSAILPTTTKPPNSSTRAIINVAEQPGRTDNLILHVYPFGDDNNDETIKVKITGWNFTKDTATGRGLWVPSVIAELTGTMSSTLVGLAGEDVLATDFFCDNITLASGGKAHIVKGTGDVDIAFARVPVYGFNLLEITCIIGTGAHANALYRFDSASVPLEV